MSSTRIIHRSLSRFVRGVGAVNEVVGVFAMYSLFVMMGILTYAVISNIILKSPAFWVMEMAQFSMAAYYLLGGGYSLKDGAQVRMDVFYEKFGPRARAIVDSITGLLLLFYLAFLVYGGISSTLYALEYSQKNFSAWGPPMAPIKIIMVAGIALMFLQALALWLRDTARALGKELT